MSGVGPTPRSLPEPCTIRVVTSSGPYSYDLVPDGVLYAKTLYGFCESVAGCHVVEKKRVDLQQGLFHGFGCGDVWGVCACTHHETNADAGNDRMISGHDLSRLHQSFDEDRLNYD